MREIKNTNIVVCGGAFDLAKETLESNGHRLASVEEVTRARLVIGQEAKKKFRWSRQEQLNYWSIEDCMNYDREKDLRYDGFTREAVIYVPQRGIFLTKNSPIIPNARAAVNAAWESYEDGRFYLSEEQIKQSLEGAVRIDTQSENEHSYFPDSCKNLSNS